MRSTQDDGKYPLADEAIPYDAVAITDAFMMVSRLIAASPQRTLYFSKECFSALEKSTRDDSRHFASLGEKFKKSQYSHRSANLFLRLEIEKRRLTACIIDPRTGTILQLWPEIWLPDAWAEYIPSGIRTDYIRGDLESPGPQGSLINGSLHRVFFMRTEFDAWLKQAFGPSAELDLRVTSPQPVFSGRMIGAVKEAVSALWGNRAPTGMNAVTREATINRWLNERGRGPASQQTIRRALAELRGERS